MTRWRSWLRDDSGGVISTRALVVTSIVIMLAWASFSALFAGRPRDRSPVGAGAALSGGTLDTPASRSTTVQPASTTDRAAALAAYRRFWQVASAVDSQPAPRWHTMLGAVTAEPLLSRVLAGLQTEAAAGQRQYGSVLLRPSVVRAERDRASIVDCQDASRAGVLDVATGLPVTAGSSRTRVAATLLRDASGTWRVSEARYLEGLC